jgi:hypothetical protein
MLIKNKTGLMLCLLSAVLLAYSFFFADNLAYRRLYSVSHRNIHFDSASADKALLGIKEFPETYSGDQTVKELTLAFRMKPADLFYDNVFQTAPGEQGVRMELYSETGRRGNLFLYISSEDGSLSEYLLRGRVKTGRWYSVALKIHKNKRISVSVNGLPVLNRREGTIDYKISDIAIGTGCSKSRNFQGEIRDFSIEYTFYRRVAGIAAGVFILKLLSFLFFCYMFFVTAAGQSTSRNDGNLFLRMGLFRTLLVSASVSYLIYYLFYYFSALIWASRSGIPQSDLVSTARYSAPDGIESFVLYPALLAGIFLTAGLDKAAVLFKRKFFSFAALVVLSVCSCAYFAGIGFHPPGALVHQNPVTVSVFVLSVLAAAFLLWRVNSKHPVLAGFLAAALCLPVCFIATAPVAAGDYSYIIAPALRLLHGFRLPEIFFQYDLLLSLLAAGLMKLNIPVNFLQVAGQAGIYAFFIGIFLFSQQVFKDKKLPVFLLFALIIARHYALHEEPVSILQATPLRLDLWLVILACVYFKGIYNITVGAALGLLLLFHRNFGTIYLVVYLQFVSILFAIDLTRAIRENTFTLSALKKICLKHLHRNKTNLSVIMLFIFAGGLLFNGLVPRSAVMYQSLGLGFLRVAGRSFFWYIPVLLSLSAAVLLARRRELPENYFNAGLFLVLLAVGNSLYFLGRSHEFNIMTSSGIYIFLLFFFFDLIGRILPDTGGPFRRNVKRLIVSFLPVVFLALTAFYYSSFSVAKIIGQFRNLTEGRFVYPLPVRVDIETVKEATGNSRKVYFLSSNDTYYYYYGGYTPQGYFCPYPTWTIKKDLISYLQGLLNNGYYLVVDFTSSIEIMQSVEDILPKLRFSKTVKKDNLLFIFGGESSLVEEIVHK